MTAWPRSSRLLTVATAFGHNPTQEGRKKLPFKVAYEQRFNSHTKVQASVLTIPTEAITLCNPSVAGFCNVGAVGTRPVLVDFGIVNQDMTKVTVR